MKPRNIQGYVEIAHTADWAIKVWAPDLAGLLGEAARGMVALMEITFEGPKLINRQIELGAEDAEELLVSFLSELLFIGESEGIGFVNAYISLQGNHLSAIVDLRKILSQRKEIKAVTFHNLVIRECAEGLETVIVFDV